MLLIYRVGLVLYRVQLCFLLEPQRSPVGKSGFSSLDAEQH